MTEAECFARYLLKQSPPPQSVELYEQATKGRDRHLSAQELRLLNFARQHPWSIGFLDAGLAWTRPSSELHHRLYLMFSLLETVPANADQFLPRQQKSRYIVTVVWATIKASFKAMVGLVLVALA